jgi:hypothetical protein
VAAGVDATRYHGQLSGSERHDNQDAFMNGSARVVVATNAFGLGVDKPDIRFVLHAQMPASLEAYYQESGRGGRDGDAAHCTLLYDVRDKRVQQFFLVGRYPDAEAIQAVDEAVVRLASTSPVGVDVLRASLPDVAAVKIRVALSLLADARMLEWLPGSTIVALDRSRRPGLYARLAARSGGDTVAPATPGHPTARVRSGRRGARAPLWRGTRATRRRRRSDRRVRRWRGAHVPRELRAADGRGVAQCGCGLSSGRADDALGAVDEASRSAAASSCFSSPVSVPPSATTSFP